MGRNTLELNSRALKLSANVLRLLVAQILPGMLLAGPKVLSILH